MQYQIIAYAIRRYATANEKAALKCIPRIFQTRPSIAFFNFHVVFRVIRSPHLVHLQVFIIKMQNELHSSVSLQSFVPHLRSAKNRRTILFFAPLNDNRTWIEIASWLGFFSSSNQETTSLCFLQIARNEMIHR